MYARRIVEKRLKECAVAMKREWIYHSISEVDTNNAYLADIFDREAGQWTRPLKPDEVDYMQNEHILCTCDFRYWAERYAFIKDWRNQIVHFKPNVAQDIFFSIWADLEEQELAIDIQALKARQLGISTGSEIGAAHRVTFYEGVNAVIGSSDPDKSWLMSQMMELVWEKMPPWMLPAQTKYNAGSLIEFGYQNSGLTIQHGSQNAGIARGTTPTVAHLSELADYQNPEELIDASLLRAMHESPYILIILESTAKGRHNWWHRTWEHSKEHWPRRESRHYPLFLPWFVGKDLYPTSTWIRAHPPREGWEPSRVTINHAERARNYVRINPILRNFLGEGWEMPREQMWYWEIQRQEALEKKTLQNFYSEMPADDEEAFQNTNQSVFDAETISIYRESTKKMPVDVFGIVANQNDIPFRLQPDQRDIDKNRKPINIRYRSPIGVKKDFQFVPLRFEGYSRTDPANKLFIWEYPQDDEEYGFGVDTGEGVGLDRSVIEVLRRGTMTKNDAQVAELASSYINAHDLSPMCLAIGQFYSNYYYGEWRQPKAVIECMQNGETVQHNLRLYGWTNFHRWVRYDSTKVRRKDSRKLGVMMVPWFRSMMLDTIIKYLRDGWCDINSPWFVSEMQDLERDEDKAYLRAMYGGHDDRIMALGNCLFSLHDLEGRGIMPSLAQGREQNFKAQDAPGYTPPWQGQEMDEQEAIYSSGFEVRDYDEEEFQ